MNSQQTSINQNALGWVKQSIDDNLSETTRDLKQYIEDRDRSILDNVNQRLDVVQGVLKMIEQYGAALLIEEMISLSNFIADQEESGNALDDQAMEVLLRAVLQLPDYLEHIQSGNRDIPMAILPLLNDIRSVKKQDLFSEKLFFLPDLSVHSDGAEIDSIDERDNQASKQLIKKLRPAFQLSLLHVIKEFEIDDNLKRLERIFEVLEEHSNSEQVARIWWITGALVESLSRHQLELGVSVKSLLGKVDSLFRVSLIDGERGLLGHQPIDLIKNLLYYIAQPECDGPKTQAIKTAYRLEEFLPSETVRSQLLTNIAGPNQALLKTVAEVVSNDIEAVKSTLEIYVNGDLSKVEMLSTIPQQLHVISDTLAMIGLGEQRQLIEAQITFVQDVVDGKSEPSESKLVAIASELIQVEQALEQMQKRQPADMDGLHSDSDVSRNFELDKVLVAIVNASLDDIQKTKSAILEFIKDPTRSDNMELCITLMEQSRGGLLMLEQQRAVSVIDGLLQYIKNYNAAEFTDVKRLDSLSQVIASLEYYLEALGERRNNAESILKLADIQLAELLAGTAVFNTTEAEIDAILDDAADMPAALNEQNIEVLESSRPTTGETHGLGSNRTVSSVFESHVDKNAAIDFQPINEPEVSAQADIDLSNGKSVNELNSGLGNIRSVLEVYEQAAPKPASIDEIAVEPVNEVLAVLKPGSDSDILEIYLEEAEEEAANIARLQKNWLLNPEDENALADIRRAFHTIKGSGRLVGAAKIAEFAWDYEHLLNQVISKAVMPEGVVIEAVGQAATALQDLVIELTTGAEPSSDIPYLRGLARALAEFKPVQVLAEQTLHLNAVESIYDQIIDAEDEDIETADQDNNKPKPVATLRAAEVSDFDSIGLEETESTSSAAKNAEEQQPRHDESAGQSPVSDPLPVLDIVDNADGPVPQAEGLDAQSVIADPNDPLALTAPTDLPGEQANLAAPVNQQQEEPTDLSFAAELLTIYQQEVEQHLDTVNAVLDQAEKNQQTMMPGEDIYRALHTIHGASSTAGIVSIGELAGLMEKPLKLAIAQKQALGQEIIALYREGCRELQAMTSELAATLNPPVIANDLKVRFQSLAEDIQAHATVAPEAREQLDGEFVDTLNMMNGMPGDERDDELITIFIEEANELLEMSDHALHQWGQQAAGDNDMQTVMELQRYLHTIKGGAKMAELNPIGDLSHELESMFIAVVDGQVEKNEALINLLKDSFDVLYQQVAQAKAGQSLSSSQQQIALLKHMRDGKNAERAEVQASEAEILQDNEEKIVQDNSDSPDAVSENLGAEPQDSGQQKQELIKVRSDLLDNLVSSAGEISIYRARMEQQVAGIGSHLGELGQTILRVKNQLRNLEAETDAQIHFSHRAESDSKGDFDPLEMDRYTLIHELSKSLGESVDDLSSLQAILGEQLKDSETLLLQQSRVNTDLQDGLIKSRMVKFSGLLPRMRRLVRQSSQELAKKAELVIQGDENEVDNKVLDRMIAPLEHIIRNAIAHGIESPADRVKKGKPEAGTIEIKVSRDGSDIVIKVSDDGAGVNLGKVRNRAQQLGLIADKQVITDSELVQFILEPGFSTTESVTQISGRGVGMDVVDIAIKQLGGTLQIETSPNGATFIARLPFTLSINQAILVRTGDETYAIPLINIEGIARLESDQLLAKYQSPKPELEYAGQQFGLHYLAALMSGAAQFRADASDQKHSIIFSRSGDVRVALHVDEILGHREIVVKSLGKQLSQVKGLSGASILADGHVVLILDINGLVRHSVSNAVNIAYSKAPEIKEAAAKARRNTVMVVDDSITMRRVASKLLQRHNYDVITAKDGIDALAQLEDANPDVMLLDIEMPRMDGFELATHMQNEPVYSNIPIIMITSRTGEKHRDRALEIGVSNYMGKPYQEEELIRNIQKALQVG